MAVKSQKNHTDVIELNAEKKKLSFGQIIRKVSGVFLALISFSVFVQGLPFVFIFIGGYIGIPTDISMNSMDAMIWLLTSVGTLAVLTVGFVYWIKFIVRRLIIYTKPIVNKKHS